MKTFYLLAVLWLSISQQSFGAQLQSQQIETISKVFGFGEPGLNEAAPEKGEDDRQWSGEDCDDCDRYPYHVGLNINGYYDSDRWCSGCLISNRYVLTAAQCIYDGRSGVVHLGISDRTEQNEPGSIRQQVGSSAFIPLNFFPASMANDIGLVRLNNAVQLGASISTIRLAPMSFAGNALIGNTGRVSGWGRFVRDCRILSDCLGRSRSVIVQNQACEQEFGDYITEGHICLAGVRDDDISDDERNYIGDGGSPLIVRRNGNQYVVGVATFGRRCGSNKPRAFTRVTDHLDRISQITGISIAP